MNTTAAIKRTVRICWRGSGNDDAQNNQPQLLLQSGKQAKLLEGPITICERNKVRFHHTNALLYVMTWNFQLIAVLHSKETHLEELRINTLFRVNRTQLDE